MPWQRREDLEDLELRSLHRFAARSRGAERRLPENDDPMRTRFQRDRDRIIHSTAFRRLQHKTQVVAAFEGDHFRSRMTHSLEVSQLVRSVSHALRLNVDLAEAVALAHDLGHPPFGHVGERTLDELMADHGGFRHNAQGLRVVDTLEDRYEHDFGLNLCATTRVSLLKGRVPDGFPVDEEVRQKAAASKIPLEASLADHCDRIAYLCHDLDDGVRAAVLDREELDGLRLWRRGRERRPNGNTAAVTGAMIAFLIHDLLETTSSDWDQGAADRPTVRHSDEARVEIEELLRFLRERFYRSRRVLDVMEAGTDRIRAAFAHFSRRPEALPEASRTRLDREPNERVICDYIAGMTDRFLVRTTEEFHGRGD
ncbi:MAG: dGTP triphosphohydrolase [Planctomycetota bacterium]